MTDMVLVLVLVLDGIFIEEMMKVVGERGKKGGRVC